MTKTTRYGLIITGLFIFVVFAPILVLYVQGKALNLETKRTELTGIIAAVTVPTSATITIGSEITEKTPVAVRFLKSGDYEVTIAKEGYYTWSKKLNVIAGKVTYAHPTPSPLRLLKNAPSNTLATNISTYTLVGDDILYAKDDKLILLREKGQTITTLATPPGTTRLTTDPSGAYVLIQGPKFTGVLRLKDLKTTDFTKPAKDATSLELSNGKLWILDASGKLTSHLTDKPGTELEAINRIYAFSIQGNDIYYLQVQENLQLSLYHATVTEAHISQQQRLATNITTAKHSQIFIDSTKAVFLLLDSTLMRVNTELENVSHSVLSGSVSSGTLAYTRPGELWWYESNTNKAHLVSRATGDYSNYYVDPSLDYAFFIHDKKLTAMELDERSGQNSYQLEDSKHSLSGLVLSSTGNITYIADTTLKTLPILDN